MPRYEIRPAGDMCRRRAATIPLMGYPVATTQAIRTVGSSKRTAPLPPWLRLPSSLVSQGWRLMVRYEERRFCRLEATPLLTDREAPEKDRAPPRRRGAYTPRDEGGRRDPRCSGIERRPTFGRLPTVADEGARSTAVILWRGYQNPIRVPRCPHDSPRVFP